jgi:hypothetical protein
MPQEELWRGAYTSAVSAPLQREFEFNLGDLEQFARFNKVFFVAHEAI